MGGSERFDCIDGLKTLTAVASVAHAFSTIGSAEVKTQARRPSGLSVSNFRTGSYQISFTSPPLARLSFFFFFFVFYVYDRVENL